MQWTERAACNPLHGRTVLMRTTKACGPGATGLVLSPRMTNPRATVTNKVMDTGEGARSRR